MRNIGKREKKKLETHFRSRLRANPSDRIATFPSSLLCNLITLVGIAAKKSNSFAWRHRAFVCSISECIMRFPFQLAPSRSSTKMSFAHFTTGSFRDYSVEIYSNVFGSGPNDDPEDRQSCIPDRSFLFFSHAESKPRTWNR